jgi:hypothetical protein
MNSHRRLPTAYGANGINLGGIEWISGSRLRYHSTLPGRSSCLANRGFSPTAIHIRPLPGSHLNIISSSRISGFGFGFAPPLPAKVAPDTLGDLLRRGDG